MQIVPCAKAQKEPYVSHAVCALNRARVECLNSLAQGAERAKLSFCMKKVETLGDVIVAYFA